jgi:hypothetical protein
MNGRKAKALRKRIYGDQSIKQERLYKWDLDSSEKKGCHGIIAVGLRRQYGTLKGRYP